MLPVGRCSMQLSSLLMTEDVLRPRATALAGRRQLHKHTHLEGAPGDVRQGRGSSPTCRSVSRGSSVPSCFEVIACLYWPWGGR